jgi:hypothetical protein
MNEMQLLLQSVNRALELMWAGDFFMAESIFKQFERRHPAFPEGLYEYASLKLLNGDYEEAWPLFQRRLEMQAYLAKKVTQFPIPYWDGSPAKESTLLIHRDQGFGDVFMSARYFPLALERVGKVMFAAPVGGRQLFQAAFPDLIIIEDGEPIPLDVIDFHLHSLSLPTVFNTTLDTIPDSNVFSADPALKKKWQARLQGKFKVGICWQGNPDQIRDTERSIPLKEMAPLMDIEGVQFYGLQVGAGEDQVANVDGNWPFEHLGPELNGKDIFVDVVAAMACMDLVITVDTAIAHLAGSMGIPVWVMVVKVPYWPYMLEGEKTPWYPSARLFRTTQRFEWDETIKTVAEELGKLVRSG